MQEFFMDYGLWLLIALLVIIGVVFLLSGKRKAETSETLTGETPVATETLPPVETPAVPPAPAPEVAPAPADIAPASAVIEDAPAPVVATPAVDVPEPETAVEPAPPAPEPTPAPKPEPGPGPGPGPVAAPVAVPIVQAPTDNGGDNLLKLKGVGPKLGALLTELGVTSFAQIAGWTDSDIATIDAKLGNFKGRPVRDQWVDQAKYLAAGDIAGFEAKYGKL